jgi:regulatory protein
MKQMASKPLSLKGRALRHLSMREHSRLELAQKLKAFEETPGAIDTLLDELEAKGFIHERRVLESLVHRRAGKLGAARIRQELLGKGLAPDMVQQAVAQLQSTELERAREVWRKKFAEPAHTPAERARQLRFLASRGFAGDVLRRVVAGADDES